MSLGGKRKAREAVKAFAHSRRYDKNPRGMDARLRAHYRRGRSEIIAKLRGALARSGSWTEKQRLTAELKRLGALQSASGSWRKTSRKRSKNRRRARNSARRTRDYKVVSVSSNTNSFGLRGVVLMSRQGDAWEIGASSHGSRAVPSQGSIVSVPVDHSGLPDFSAKGWEIPRRLGKPPAKVVRAVWK